MTDDEVGAGEGGQIVGGGGLQRLPRPRYRRRVPRQSRLSSSCQQTANKENLRPPAANKIHPANPMSQTSNINKTLPEVTDKHIKVYPLSLSFHFIIDIYVYIYL